MSNVTREVADFLKFLGGLNLVFRYGKADVQ